MISDKSDFQKMIMMLEELPEFKQIAAKWALSHWELVERLCEQEEPLSSEEFEKRTQQAIDTQDHAYYALLVYLKVKSKCKETENQE